MQPRSVFQRLQDELGQLISETEPGDRLPSEPSLSKQLGVSRATLREAMRTFETQGLIRRLQGSGTYVNDPSQVIESGLEMLESIETMAKRSQLQVTMGKLTVESRRASEEEASALRIANGENVTSVKRVIQTDGRPVAYLIDVLPESVLLHNGLGEDFTGSVLDLLIERGNPPLMVSRTNIGAATAPREVARALGIQRNDVLLCFTAELYTTDGRVVDYSISYFLPGYFRFHVVRKVG